MSIQFFAAWLLCFVSCFSAWSATITDAALGSQLAGGFVTVTRFGGGMSTAPFVAAGTGASATSPGSAGFTLIVSAGDTAAATWTLTNTDASLILLNRITAVTIDLFFSGISVFDSGSVPSTPDSGPGLPGVVPVAGVGIGGSTYLLPWPDGSNLGDIYYALNITFTGAGLTAGLASSWMTDTDLLPVPEPGSLLLTGGILLLGIAKAILSRRRIFVSPVDCA